MISAIHHSGVLVADTRTAVDFYVDVLGLSVDPSRPDLGYPGAWLTVGRQQLHLLELPNPDPRDGRPAHVGRDRHTAFTVSDLRPIKQRLDVAGIPYTMSRSGRQALFCRDPDGNGLELVQTIDD